MIFLLSCVLFVATVYSIPAAKRAPVELWGTCNEPSIGINGPLPCVDGSQCICKDASKFCLPFADRSFRSPPNLKPFRNVGNRSTGYGATTRHGNVSNPATCQLLPTHPQLALPVMVKLVAMAAMVESLLLKTSRPLLQWRAAHRLCLSPRLQPQILCQAHHRVVQTR